MTPCATFPGAGGFSEQQRHLTSPFPSPRGFPCLQQWLLLLVQCLQEDAHLKSVSHAEGQCRKWFETQAKWLQQVTASFLHTLVTISNLFNLILFYLNNWRKKNKWQKELALPFTLHTKVSPDICPEASISGGG